MAQMKDKDQGNDTTKILSYVLVAIIAFAGGYLVNGLSPQGGSSGSSSDSGAAVNPTAAEGDGGGGAYDSDKIPIGNSPTKGPKDALVTIVEFSEFQCPFCKKGEKRISKVLENYPDKVRVVFKHYPLPFHKQAKPAARAALAAKEQGKFWEMHDKLFANQKKFKGGGVKDLATGWAKEMGLDVGKFKKDLKNNKSKYNSIIERDMKMGKKLGVKGTPHFIINGKALSGAQPYSKFKSVVENKIDEAKKMLKGGTKRADLYKKTLAKNFQKPSKGQDKKKKKKPGKKKAQVQYVPVSDHNPVKGATKDPLVTVVEFSEFQCPFCKKAFPSLKKLQKNYGDKVRFVFKHNPLPFHKQAKPAAKASIAAQEQGKFWEMHNLLFKNQKKLKGGGSDLFNKLAGQIGLNQSKFKETMNSDMASERIKSDQDLARKVGAKGTPTFFINGVKVVGAQPYSKFKSTVETQIERAQQVKDEKGVSGEKLYKAVVELNKEKSGGGGGQPSAKKKKKPAPKVDTSKLKIGKAPVKGPEDAPVTIYEFSDFECPYCSKAHKTLGKVLPDYEGKVKVVHKNYPLPFHKKAKPAARAALAAKEQGKFWTMYDLLFKNQGKLGQSGLYEKLARKAGLNVDQFKKDMKSNKSEYNKLIKDQMSQGKKVGVKGTPAFFINGQRLVGAQPASKFRSAIDKALEGG